MSETPAFGRLAHRSDVASQNGPMQPDRGSRHGGPRRPVPVRAAIVAIVAIGALVVTGCSDGDAGGPTALTASIPTAPSTDEGAAATVTSTSTTAVTSSEGATSTEVPATASTEMASTDTVATVPDQRVPGLDSTDGFCRGWSEFAGSFQALAYASATGSDDVAAARLEVVASGAVSEAVRLLADEFPESIAFERDLFVDDVIGPFARRAGRASDELRTAGLSSDQIDQLAEAWLSALADADADEPAIVVAVPDEFAGAVDAATAVFSTDVPLIVADSSLVTDAAAPATLGYLAENCPDQGILGGNDAVG